MFENFTKKVTETGAVIGDKAKQITETTKLNIKITEAKHAVDEMYKSLGMAFFEEEKSNADSKFYSECQAIEAKLDEIKKYKDEIYAIKGVILCENCGAEVPIEYDFCGKCGTKVIKPEVVIDADVEEATETVAEEVVTDEINEEKTEE